MELRLLSRSSLNSKKLPDHNYVTAKKLPDHILNIDSKNNRNRFIATLLVLCVVLTACIVCLVLGNSSIQATGSTDSLEPSNDVALTDEQVAQKEEEEKVRAEFELRSTREKTLSDLITSRFGENSSAWGVYVKGIDVDFEVNFGSHQMKSASIIKPFIAATYFTNRDVLAAQGVNVANGDNLVQKMISASDNSATNALIDYCGGFDAINDYCANSGYADTHLGRYMLASSVADDNFTSVKDCALLLSRIYTGEVPSSNLILDAMFAQERRSKIPAGITDGSRVANKTGEISGVENDIAIIEGTHKYVLCIMSDTGSSSSAVSEIVALTRQINQAVQAF